MRPAPVAVAPRRARSRRQRRRAAPFLHPALAHLLRQLLLSRRPLHASERLLRRVLRRPRPAPAMAERNLRCRKPRQLAVLVLRRCHSRVSHRHPRRPLASCRLRLHHRHQQRRGRQLPLLHKSLSRYRHRRSPSCALLRRLALLLRLLRLLCRLFA